MSSSGDRCRAVDSKMDVTVSWKVFRLDPDKRHDLTSEHRSGSQTVELVGISALWTVGEKNST